MSTNKSATEKAWDELARLTSAPGPAQNWRWSIPASPGDSDLILAAGLDEQQARIAELERRLQSARIELSQTRAAADKIITDFQQYRITTGIAAAIYDATIEQLTGERDRARDVAVLLEQELAAARAGRVSAP